jgi:hypothetical protein
MGPSKLRPQTFRADSLVNLSPVTAISFIKRPLLRRYRVLGSLLAVVGLTACTDTTAPVPCPGDNVVLTVTTERPLTVPQFVWSPACPMVMVQVQIEGAAGIVPWTVESSGNRIMPPVTYGHVPKGGTLSTSAQPLDSAATYVVSVWREIWRDGGSALYRQAGVALFQPEGASGS